MTLTTVAHAKLPNVSKKGKETQSFNEMTVNLLSVRQLCNDGCTVTFTKKKATVLRNNKPIMTTPRHERNGMWIYNFDEPENILSNHTSTMNNIYEMTKAKELITCLHLAAVFPVVESWVPYGMDNLLCGQD